MLYNWVTSMTGSPRVIAGAHPQFQSRFAGRRICQSEVLSKATTPGPWRHQFRYVILGGLTR
jgi:hypothetical protein